MANEPAVRPELKFTYEDYCTLPEGSRYQLIEGDLIVSPSPTLRHQIIVMRIAAALFNFVTSGKLGLVCSSPIDVILSPHDTVQPDVVYVSNSRASRIVREGIRGGPDLCVEVLSEGTRSRDRGVKKKLYARHGVSEYWIVDPESKTLEIYRLQEKPDAPVRTFAEKDTLTTDLLRGFSLDLSEVFAD